jgi:hypothetical protein
MKKRVTCQHAARQLLHHCRLRALLLYPVLSVCNAVVADIYLTSCRHQSTTEMHSPHAGLTGWVRNKWLNRSHLERWMARSWGVATATRVARQTWRLSSLHWQDLNGRLAASACTKTVVWCTFAVLCDVRRVLWRVTSAPIWVLFAMIVASSRGIAWMNAGLRAISVAVLAVLCGGGRATAEQQYRSSS